MKGIPFLLGVLGPLLSGGCCLNPCAGFPADVGPVFEWAFSWVSEGVQVAVAAQEFRKTNGAWPTVPAELKGEAGTWWERWQEASFSTSPSGFHVRNVIRQEGKPVGEISLQVPAEGEARTMSFKMSDSVNR